MSRAVGGPGVTLRRTSGRLWDAPLSDPFHKVTFRRIDTRREPPLELYTPVLAIGVLAALFAVFSVVTSTFTGPARYNRARLDSYECGIEPTPQPLGGGRIPVKYYTVAMTFIIFDVEIMFLVPWAVHFDQLSWFGLVAVFLFLFNITLAYAYEWRRGGLDWD